MSEKRFVYNSLPSTEMVTTHTNRLTSNSSTYHVPWGVNSPRICPSEMTHAQGSSRPQTSRMPVKFPVVSTRSALTLNSHACTVNTTGVHAMFAGVTTSDLLFWDTELCQNLLSCHSLKRAGSFFCHSIICWPVLSATFRQTTTWRSRCQTRGARLRKLV